MTPEPEWISMKASAAAAGVSEKTIRRRIASGDLEAMRFGPRLIRVKRSSLEALGSPLGTATR